MSQSVDSASALVSWQVEVPNQRMGTLGEVEPGLRAVSLFVLFFFLPATGQNVGGDRRGFPLLPVPPCETGEICPASSG